MSPSSRRSSVAPVPHTFFRQVADLMARREPVVLVTVIEAAGSVPGKTGAKMAVALRGLHGTVGGGRIEKSALEHAREILSRVSGSPAAATRPELVHYDLVRDLGMSCGGSVTLLFELMPLPPRLVLFGAGHVAEPLCAMASLAGFDVTVCDEREEWLTAERFPTARERILDDLVAAVDRAAIDSETFVISLTPGHAFDLSIVRRIHEANLVPRYLGVIGSRRKAVSLRKELAEGGADPAFVRALRVPVGLDIGAVDPREIAVSVVAELVAELHGIDKVEPW